ncbi:MAG: hypothetical protein DRR42_25490 [Gammaproteobacteria bacterium]|nr:MAG: hypothetical protein DRR42_25490 [Gammaproteobacteria bacterium]
MENDSKRLTIPALTGVRGIAAIWVVLHHLMGRWSFVESDYGAFSRLVDRGWLGVDLFFILSGFVISYVHRDDFKGHLSIKLTLRFLVLRLARIYPVHLVMTLAFVPVFFVSKYFLSFDVGDTFSLSKFLYSIFLINGWGLIEGGGWNGPSWSVSSEWFAYLAFPIIALFLSKYRRRWVSIIIIIIIFIGSTVLAFKLNNGSQYMLGEKWTLFRVSTEFIIGCALRNIFDSLYKSIVWDIVGSIAVILSIAFCVLDPSHFYDFFIIACFAVIVVSLSLANGFFAKIFGSRVLCYLGVVSYSMYMVHWIFILVLSKLDRNIFLDDQNYQFMAQIFVAISFFVVVILAAHFMYYLVEAPMRRRLRPR